MEKLAASTVAVFGVGGVGSYAAEGLARAGVGHIVLVDNDLICLTNINRSVIKSPADIVPYLKHIVLEPTERFLCVSMNGAHEILNINVVSIGTASRTLVHPREVLANPVMEHASGIICCHNHPFGPCLPSSADLETTRVLIRASTLLGISFLDHIILTRDSFFSFLANGLMDEGEIDRKCGVEPEERDSESAMD